MLKGRQRPQWTDPWPGTSWIDDYNRCPAIEDISGARCQLSIGHPGHHTGESGIQSRPPIRWDWYTPDQSQGEP